MRRIISLATALALVIGGVGLFLRLYLVAVAPVKTIVLLAPLFVAGLGGLWL